MLARRIIPPGYVEFNSHESAPWGHPYRADVGRRIGSHHRLGVKVGGLYAWQPNSETRVYEYPWVHDQITQHGSRLTIIDVGASVAGLQYTLARDGHNVHAVDPGLAAEGRGWKLDARLHRRIADVHNAPVRLHVVPLQDVAIPDAYADVILSVSTIEHFSAEDIDAFAHAARRILKPHGKFILTIDLFLDLYPFTRRENNQWGTNVNVAVLLEKLDAELIVGEPAELFGFSEFDPGVIQSRLEKYSLSHMGSMAQCLVAVPRDPIAVERRRAREVS